MSVLVFGGGSFGTALAYKVAKNATSVIIISRNQKVVDGINNNHRNPQYLKNVKYTLPSNVSASSNIKKTLIDNPPDYIVHTIPVQSSQAFLSDIAALVPSQTPIISASKGISVDSLHYMHQIVAASLGSAQPFAALSGPSFAKELVLDIPTLVTVASQDESVAEQVQTLFHHPTFRVYTSDDVIGVEVGGALKNIFAIAAGIIDSLGKTHKFGLNTQAALLTRGVNEMMRLAVALGANPLTLSGLSGIGDLILTATGSLSRNRTVGVRLGAGESMQEIIASSSEVAEGVATTPAAVELAEQLDIEVPIISAVHKAIKGEMTPIEIVHELLQRAPSKERK